MIEAKTPDDISKEIDRAIVEGYKHPKLTEAIAGIRFVELIIEGTTLLWIFMGKSEDHIIIPRTYCSCKDFIIHVLSQKRKLFCYHLVAQVIAEKEGKYRRVNVDIDTCSRIINEVLEKGFSTTLRRIVLKS